ncbi:hypothetical protein [Escherichia coli]|nr:hypothetical protein [Escherichia coli]
MSIFRIHLDGKKKA